RKADKRDKGLPIIGLPEDLDHFYLTDVFLNNNLYQWSASDGVLMKVGGNGRTIKEATAAAYERAKSIRVEGAQYRVDIASGAERNISQLKKWGYLAPGSLLRRAVG
ncbi:hypothetical protein LCGC14_2569670, partial [marine sediment metagenome]